MKSDFFPSLPSRKSPPTTPRKIIRILLGETSSKALDETGLPAFAVCGCERTPEHPRRWVIYLAETRHPQAQECIAIMRNAANQSNKSES